MRILARALQIYWLFGKLYVLLLHFPSLYTIYSRVSNAHRSSSVGFNRAFAWLWLQNWAQTPSNLQCNDNVLGIENKKRVRAAAEKPIRALHPFNNTDSLINYKENKGTSRMRRTKKQRLFHKPQWIWTRNKWNKCPSKYDTRLQASPITFVSNFDHRRLSVRCHLMCSIDTWFGLKHLLNFFCNDRVANDIFIQCGNGDMKKTWRKECEILYWEQ